MWKRIKSWFSGGQMTPLAGVSSEQLRNAMGEVIMSEWLRERRADRRWMWFRRIAISGAGLALFATYMYYQLQQQGWRWMPSEDVVGVVNVSGMIGQGQLASAEKIIPVLEKAFKAPNVKGIILNVDSPGGQPNESERINAYIDLKKKETGKKVYAVSANVNASAAYLISLHADEIYTGKYSLDGSIGAKISTFDAHKLIQRLDLASRTYTSGRHKDLLNPFAAMTSEGDEVILDMVVRMGKTFADEVRAQRKNKLKEGVEYFTGRAWTGEQAVEIGLVDGIGTIEDVAKRKFNLKLHEMGPFQNSGFPFLGASIENFIVTAVQNSLVRAQTSW